MRSVNILGSTGSVGTSTVDLIKSAPDKFRVNILTANKNVDLLIRQAQELKPALVAIGDESQYEAVKNALPGIKILAGIFGIEEASAEKADLTVAAIVGVAGLKPVLHAVRNSKAVAIANKEPLVAAGELILGEARKHNTTILPVDSEHNAIFQVFEQKNKSAIDRIILTASGGPFREWSMEQIEKATPEQAVAHPNWSMGAKISVDSASMMNKGLEIIEAHHLFGMDADRIDVMLHPQSIIHSMVEYADGSVLAQLGAPDMRTPIAYALAWPERMATTGQKLDLQKMRQLDFGEVDTVRFPCLAMAYEALRAGQDACIALNAANEAAVEAFLSKRIGFTDIARLIRDILNEPHGNKYPSLEDIVAYDAEIKDKIQRAI